MISIDLTDACLRVPIHSDSRKFLRRELCLGLLLAFPVFTYVITPGLVMFSQPGH